MNYQIHVIPAAEREIKKLPRTDLAEIKQTISALEKEPFPAGYVKLSGCLKKNVYRVRSNRNRYRIIYTIDSAAHLIKILRVALRKEVYQRLSELIARS